MANYWNFSARAKGGEESIGKFVSLTHAFGNEPSEERWLDFSEIFDAEREENADGTVSVTLHCGNSKGPWGELVYADDAYPGAVSLIDVSAELDLLVEMFIYGDECSSHLVIDRGEEVLAEDSEVNDLVWETGRYETFDEWREANQVPEGTTLRDVLDSENRAYGEVLYDVDMTWEEFVEHMEPYDGEYFHFGQIDENWTI